MQYTVKSTDAPILYIFCNIVGHCEAGQKVAITLAVSYPTVSTQACYGPIVLSKRLQQYPLSFIWPSMLYLLAVKGLEGGVRIYT